MSDIDDKTKISLFAVICAVPFLLGGMAWLTSVDAKATQARDKATEVHDEVLALKALAVDIRERQIRLEQMIKDLTKQ